METLLFGGSAERLGAQRVAELKSAAAPLSVVITEDPQQINHHLHSTIVAARNIPVSALADAPRLRWYQHWYAGVEHLVASAGWQTRKVTVTNGSGVGAEPIAEQVFGMLLSFERDLHRSIRRQSTHEWPPDSVHRVGELHGKTILIVGLGAIGSRIAEIAEVFGMTVIGVKRSPLPDSPFRVVQLGELPEVLPTADVVVSVLPLTELTRNLFDKRAFAAMKSGAVFVNVGRGGLVDQEALIATLQSGHLGAAGLDVTTPEPLPSESPLWEMENVIVTPHMSGDTPAYDERIWLIFYDNLKRFHAGEPLRNVIDFEAGY